MHVFNISVLSTRGSAYLLQQRQECCYSDIQIYNLLLYVGLSECIKDALLFPKKCVLWGGGLLFITLIKY